MSKSLSKTDYKLSGDSTQVVFPVHFGFKFSTCTGLKAGFLFYFNKSQKVYQWQRQLLIPDLMA